MFDLLQAGGYDRAEVWYRSYDGDGWVEHVNLYKGDRQAGRRHVTKELESAIAQYLDAYLPDGWCFGDESYGMATLVVSGRSSYFEHSEFSPESMAFADRAPTSGVPTPRR
jgi:hypothetical protein